MQLIDHVVQILPRNPVEGLASIFRGSDRLVVEDVAQPGVERVAIDPAAEHERQHGQHCRAQPRIELPIPCDFERTLQQAPIRIRSLGPVFLGIELFEEVQERSAPSSQ